RTMPEEINRLVTDVLRDLLFVTERSGLTNLAREGVDPAKVHLVGNVMIDTLRWNLAEAEKSDVLKRLGVAPQSLAVLTVAWPANVERAESTGQILGALEEISRRHAIVFPMHPRTRVNMEKSGMMARLSGMPGMRVLEPQGYLDFLKLLAQ